MNKMLVLVCLFILHISISAQYYISVSGGYALPAGEGILFAKPMDFSAYDRVHGSYGQGWKLNAAFGRTLTEALAIELEGGYSYGKSISVENATLTLNYFEIAALATIRAQRNGFAPYIKLGPVVAFPKLTETVAESEGANGGAELSGNPALGLRSKLGVEFIQPGVKYFIEVGITELCWYPDSYSAYYGPYKGNGNIVNSILYSSETDRSFNYRFPLSDFSFNCGFAFTF